MKKSLIISWFVFAIFQPRPGFAGECKVSNPAPDVVIDAKALSTLNEFALGEIVHEFETKTRKKLQIVIVARAGQDFSDQVVLRDLDGRSPLTLANIYEAARADQDSYKSNYRGRQFDFAAYKNVVREKFRDPIRSMEFSHVGFLVRNHPNAPALKPGEGKMWRTRHMLRPCEIKDPKTEFEKIQQRDLNVPYLWDEGALNFFADNPHELKIRYLVPAPELQDALMRTVFRENIYELNSRYYNAAANWRNTKESNSNQWVLEVLAAATRPASQVQSRRDAQEILAKMNYRPTKILFQGHKALAYIPGARKIAPYLTYHAEEQPYYQKGGLGEVISALSVEDFMERNGILFGKYQTPTLEKTKDKRAKIAPQ